MRCPFIYRVLYSECLYRRFYCERILDLLGAIVIKRIFKHIIDVTIHHVMPREKICGALDSCFGLVGPHQQSIPQLLSLASRIYKELSMHIPYLLIANMLILSSFSLIETTGACKHVFSLHFTSILSSLSSHTC